MVSKGVIILLVLLIISLIANGYFLMGSSPKNALQTANQTTTLQAKYPFLSRKTLTEYDRDILINFLGLRKQLTVEIEPYKDTFGMYFEYMPTGTSIGINEDAEFYAASLIKVPIVMAYYYQRERLGNKNDPEITINEEDLNDKFGELYKRGAGSNLRMSEAVKLALQASDNTAGDIILHRIDEADFMHVYEGLDIPLKVENQETIISAQQYASVLKSLFYSSILDRDDSNEILRLLTQTKFPDKLPAGLPTNVPAAHKVGVLGGELYQDCGIIYLPRRPYLLCMISNSTEEVANTRMSKVSKIIYDFVSEAAPTVGRNH